MGWKRARIVILNAKLITTQQTQEITTTTKQSKKGVQYKVTPTVQKQSLGEKIVSTDLIPFMRSRNIDVTTTRMKPRTQFYAFFDGVDMTKFLTPKLLEIEMVSGVFEVGETVIDVPRKFSLVANLLKMVLLLESLHLTIKKVLRMHQLRSMH